MRLGWTTNKSSTTYRAVKTIRVNGKNKTLLIKTFGTDKFICETYGVSDAKAWAKEQVRHMNEAEMEDASFMIELSAERELALNSRKCFNGGYLFLQDIYYELGLHKIRRAIAARHDFQYDLNAILSRLIDTRILYPSSKKSSFEDSKRFLEQPTFALHDIYRSFSVIAEESDYIQSRLSETAAGSLKEKPASSIMTARIFTLKSSRQRRINSMASARKTVPYRSWRWGSSWTGREFPLHLGFHRATAMSRLR